MAGTTQIVRDTANDFEAVRGRLRRMLLHMYVGMSIINALIALALYYALKG